ncbi:unnamed protein product [Mytilus edulis]|uniref:Uncharacterized protein n=1 Tax=Mytilus edulis TaxID=6550 RepID=A0A8S3QYP6_MYTED|nr:unnamed protein product [Mytilus edulis]
MKSEVSLAWGRLKGGFKRFLGRPAVEKVGISIFIAASLAMLRTNTWDHFMDMSIWCVVYLNWCFFVLPSIKEKLTLTMVWNVAYVIITLFLADVLFYGLYGYAKRHFLEQGIAMESTEMQSWAFFMNIARICCMLFCVVSSRSKWTSQTPHKKTIKSILEEELTTIGSKWTLQTPHKKTIKSILEEELTTIGSKWTLQTPHKKTIKSILEEELTTIGSKWTLQTPHKKTIKSILEEELTTIGSKWTLQTPHKKTIKSILEEELTTIGSKWTLQTPHKKTIKSILEEELTTIGSRWTLQTPHKKTIKSIL